MNDNVLIAITIVVVGFVVSVIVCCSIKSEKYDNEIAKIYISKGYIQDNWGHWKKP